MRLSSFAQLPAPHFALVALGAVLLLVYSSALRGPFVFDDFPNIVNNPAVTHPDATLSALANAAWSGESGPLKRPLAYLSFAVNSLLAGGLSNTLPFKLTNLLIHILNALLVSLLATRLSQLASRQGGSLRRTADVWIGVAAGALWALHPMQTTPVLHVVQRMTSLSATFVLLGTLVFLAGRECLQSRPRKAWSLMWGGLGIGLIGLTAKENAAVMPLLLFAIECTMFSDARDDERTRMQLRRFYNLICGIPLLATIAWLAWHPDFISAGYANRDFTPTQRLLTEARVLWFYLYLLAVPDITRLTLFHDDFTLSTDLLHPWTTIPAVLALVTAFVFAVRVRHHLPLLALAILWFFIGHVIESSIVGLELVHEHRNYLPDIVLFVAIPHGVVHLARDRRWAALAGAVLIFVYSGITSMRVHDWSRDDLLIESMARYHPDSARSQAMMGELLAYRAHSLPAALPYYRSAMALAPNDAAFSLQMLAAMLTVHDANNSSPPDITGLSRRIVEQLGSRSPSPPAIGQIDKFSECVVKEPTRCGLLYSDVLAWCFALLDSPKITPTVRRFAVDHALYIAVSRHDYRSALEAVKRARRVEPEDEVYAITEADMLVHLGNIAEADQILTSLGTTKSPNLDEKLAAIRSAIATTRNR